MSRDVKALAVDVEGEVREVTLRAGEQLPCLYSAIGCDTVDVVALAEDLDMWLDDNGFGVGPVNVPATMLKDLCRPHTQPYFGVAVFTGGVDDEGDSMSLSPTREAWIRETLADLA